MDKRDYRKIERTVRPGGFYIQVILTFILLLAAGCAGPTKEAARFRIAALASEPRIPHRVDKGEFRGKSLKDIEGSAVTSKGGQILRDKALIDVNIAAFLKEKGIPDAVEIWFTTAGLTNYLTIYYKDPPKSYFFKRTMEDIEWFSVRELEKSALIEELNAVPRSVERISFGSPALPPPWPVTIPVGEFIEIVALPMPNEPPNRLEEVNPTPSYDVLEALKGLPEPSTEARDRAELALRSLSEAASSTAIAWHLVVFTSTGLTAFSTPDGTLFLSDSLVETLDDRELASVVAHLMAHEWYQHGHKLMKRADTFGFIFLLNTAVSLKVSGHPGTTAVPAITLLTGGYTELLSNPSLGYLKEEEIEANYKAARMLKTIGIPPDTLFDALLKLKEKSPPPQGGTSGFSNVHRLDSSTRDLGILLDSGIVR